MFTFLNTSRRIEAPGCGHPFLTAPIPALETIQLLSVCVDVPIPDTSQTQSCAAFSVWLPSLTLPVSTMFIGSIHVVACISNFPIGKGPFIMWIFHILPLLSVDRHLVCFHFFGYCDYCCEHSWTGCTDLFLSLLGVNCWSYGL